MPTTNSPSKWSNVANAPQQPARRGLGQGLSILLGDSASPGESGLRELPVSRLRPNPRQPRARLQESAFAELVESVRRDGVIQPVLVRATDDGWELIAGERRWRAAQAAGLTTIPALVRESDDRESLTLAIAENVVRHDLNPIEQARAYGRMLDEFGATHAEIAAAFGRSRAAVSNTIRLLDLPDDVLTRIEEGDLSEGHGRALLAVDDHVRRSELASSAVAQGWSVREIEARARPANASAKPRVARSGGMDPDAMNNAIDRSFELFALPATVTPAGEGCKLTVSCANAAEFAQLVARLGELASFRP